MPSLCDFCLTEVWGDKGWQKTWAKYATDEKLRRDRYWQLHYERLYEDFKTSARSCFFCRLVCKHVKDTIRRCDIREIPEYVLLGIYHRTPSGVTPGTCAVLQVSWDTRPDEDDPEFISQWQYFYLGVSTVVGDPAASYYLAPTPICGPYSNFEPEVAKDLLEKCHQTHAQCRSPSMTRLPTRVLDCGQAHICSRVRLLQVENGHHGQYAALSYVWGKNQNLLTSRDNLLAHSEGIDVCAMPNTVKDAVQVTRELNLRYLWVDALCIIQDSASDKVKELRRMSEYYRDAFCVIAASASHGADEGFLKLRHRSRERFPVLGKPADVVHTELNVPFLGPAGERGSITLNSERLLHYDAGITYKNPLKGRAWALQERLLCSRYLHFPAEQGFVLQCDHEEQFAGKIVYSTHAADGGRRGRDRMLQATHREDGGGLAMPDVRIEVCETWRRMVDEYSAMTLSFVEDRLIAIAALAEYYHGPHETHLGSYLAGHWRGEPVYSLVWHVDKNEIKARQVYRAPTWSWASVDGRVRYLPKFRAYTEMVDIVDAGTTLLHPSLPFGAVTDGFLKVSGRLHRTLWRPRGSSDTVSEPRGQEDAGLLLPKIVSRWTEQYDGFDSDGYHWQHVWPDTLQSPTAFAEPVDMLLMSSDYFGGLNASSLNVLLLQPCDKGTYRRVGRAEIDGLHVDHDALFKDEKTTICII